VFDVKDGVAAEGRTGPPGAVGFASGPGSYRWVYLPAADGDKGADRVRLPVGTTGGQDVEFPRVRLATRTDMERLGIPGPYALVEVSVNDGRGSPGGEAFVASRLRLLERPDGGLRVGPKVEELRKKFEEFEAGQTEAVARAVRGLAEQELGGRPLTGPRETTRRVRVTWLSESDRLRVEFRTRVTDGEYKTGKGTEPSGGPRPARGPGRSPAGGRFGTMLGVEFGMAYEVFEDGKLAASEPIPLSAFRRDIPAPR
jgi:hypothetical protein